MPSLRPLFIGLPGAGKSTLSSRTASKLGFQVIATDPLFRVFRALPSSSKDPRAVVMRRFLERAKKLYPKHHHALQEDALTLDAKGRCALAGSVRFRTYGEEVFRLFEIEMLKWLDENGEFHNKIVDLSASAPLFPDNQALFSPEHGYRAILIDTPQEMIVKNLLKDYMRYRAQSLEAGEKKPIRGAYEKAIDDALKETNPTSSEGQKIILETAAALTRLAEEKRGEKYRAFTQGIILHPTQETSLETLVDEALALCEG